MSAIACLTLNTKSQVQIPWMSSKICHNLYSDNVQAQNKLNSKAASEELNSLTSSASSEQEEQPLRWEGTSTLSGASNRARAEQLSSAREHRLEKRHHGNTQLRQESI
ncbi:hypothetical protein AVEN_140580-1 [Araneus ventricosus]|uniref:Uncharacterized protein n=1 Tax=Araneus ventricosus TaxID=182803 RepID=A0A4Y2KW24_ARAVE|nr:hypothetical protein AVEN_140580-1 [Araneus ventricosus]